jgi:hypothetical protein
MTSCLFVQWNLVGRRRTLSTVKQAQLQQCANMHTTPTKDTKTWAYHRGHSMRDAGISKGTTTGERGAPPAQVRHEPLSLSYATIYSGSFPAVRKRAQGNAKAPGAHHPTSTVMTPHSLVHGLKFLTRRTRASRPRWAGHRGLNSRPPFAWIYVSSGTWRGGGHSHGHCEPPALRLRLAPTGACPSRLASAPTAVPNLRRR